MTNKLTVGYVRCSSDLQDISHQINSIEDYTKRLGLTIDKVIKDEGVSAYRKDFSARDGMMELLQIAKKGEVENLIIFESSRISRQFIESQNLIDELTKCGIKIHSVSDNGIINGAEIDQLMNAFKSFMNMQSSKDTGLRVKSAHAKLRSEGKFVAGGIPFGFTINSDGYLIPIEDMKNLIISMFEDYIINGSKYTQEKYKMKTRKVLIDRISNEVYKDIVGDTLFIRANQIRNSRRCISNKTAVALNRSGVLLEGLLYHAHCGSKLYINRDNRLKTESSISFRCVKCRGRAAGIKKSFSASKLTKAIEAEIVNILNNLNHDMLYEKYNSRCTKKRLILELQLKNLKDEADDINKVISKAKDKLTVAIIEDNDVLINTIGDLIANKETEAEEISAQISNKEALLNSIEETENHNELFIKEILNAKSIYKNADIQNKKAILQLLIKKIEVSDVNDFDIYLNI